MSKSNDTPCPNLDEFVELYQYVNVTPDTENLPVETNLDFGSAINIGLSSGVMIQILYSRYGDIFVRGYAYWEIPKWKPWVPIVTATPPQRYVLQLADGWVRVNAAEYWRTQEGLVIVTFRIARSGGAEISAAPHPIATLPEGYRPVGYAAHVAASTMTAVPAVVWVGDDGVIYASAAQDIPESSDPAPGNWPGFVATMVFCAN